MKPWKGISLFVACLAVASATVVLAQSENKLSPQEKQAGWILLFNGKNLDGWHSYLQKGVGEDWSVHDGAIVLRKSPGDAPEDYADLVTDGEFSNFDLKLEWKASPCIDSGIMFYVHESPEYKATYETGPEMQIADRSCTVPDSTTPMERAGDLFALIPSPQQWVRPAGQWNQYEIRADRGHLQFFINGHKSVDAQLWGAQWKRLVAGSKFAKMPNFGAFKTGHISLQGTEPKGKPGIKIWFRNLRLKKL